MKIQFYRVVAASFSLSLSLCPAPAIEKTVLFARNQGNYLFYRIPGVVVTKNGAILVYAEARRSDRSDWGPTDILLRRSTDRGLSWSAPAVIGAMPEAFPKNPAALARNLGSGTTYNNPVAIPGRDGAVHFLFCVEYMRVFYMRSDDDGRTFTKPVEITAALEPLRRIFPWVVVATGPGHGIQLRNGRLLVPVWLSLGTGAGAHGDSVVSVLYSDDRGATWKAGGIAVPNNAETVSPNETVAVETAAGVMLNVRSPSPPQRRIVVRSNDGATRWSPPAFDEHLPDPVCAAGMVRLDRHRLLFSNPDSGPGRDRRNLTVRLSPDQGKTWPVKRALEPGPSAYSDLAVLPGGTILCFYEAGTATQYDTLTLARFNLEWLTAGSDSRQGRR
jgi:sialidase-1